MKGEGRVISTVVFSLVIFVAFTLAPIVRLSTARTTYATQDSSKANGSLEEANVEQAGITEHKVTASELEKLKREIGVWKEGEKSNQILNGHGTGLRPPTESEWTQIAAHGNIVDSVSIRSAGQLLSRVDWSESPWFPPIGNQDGEGSCVAWAIGYYTKTFQEAKEHGWNLTDAHWVGSCPTAEFQDKIISPAFVYHLTNSGLNTGTVYGAAINLVCSIGACSWARMPWNSSDQSTWPSEDAWREAAYYRGASTGYETMSVGTDEGILSLKNWLASENLAVIAVDAYQYPSLTGDDLWTIDNYNGGAGHANTIVGYDDAITYMEGGQLSRGAFKIANSWGVGGWEQVSDGFYWISYKAMSQKIGYVMFYRDRVGYVPVLTCTFRIDHRLRGECSVSVGVGNHDAPDVSKCFTEYVYGGDQPFCLNSIVFDITDFTDVLPTVYDKSFFISVSGGSNVTGTLTAFSVHNVVSGDPPLTIVNNGTVFADVFLPHTINVRSDYSTIQEAVNSVVLGTSEDPGVIINVPPGTYNENVLVNKTVSMVGESPETTIINGSYFTPVFDVLANNVHITDLTIVDGAHGILIVSSNNTISENNIINNYNGIYLDSSSDNNSIIGNNITANDGYGILIWRSSDNRLAGNIVTNNGDGIRLYSSFDNGISDNNITNNGCGIQLSESSNNTLADNIMVGNGYNFGVSGSYLSDFVNDVDMNNTVNGKPVCYWIDRLDATVPLDAGYVALINCTSITVQNLNLTSNGQDILLAYTTNSTITKNDVANNYDGIELLGSSSNTISGNSLTNSSIFLGGSSGNNIIGNAMTGDNYWNGFYLGGSSGNNIIGNNVTSYGAGFVLQSSSYNSIYENSVVADYFGILLNSSSNCNSIIGNRVTANNGCGIGLFSGSGNTIYHNNFMGNNQKVYSDWGNVWDAGYPFGGNYWSDYAGVDKKSGPNQDQLGSDGIGDTGYTIENNNTDRYPLMQPWTVRHNVAVIIVVAAKTVVGLGFSGNVTVLVADKGDCAETFNVTVYANTTVIGTQHVSNLNMTSQVALTFILNTTGLAYGNYTIRAYAETVPGETDAADNNSTGGVVTVTSPGDINGDFTVDIYDALTLAGAYNSKPNSPNWNLNADINSDNVVDIYDAILLANNYGKTA